MKNKTVFWVTEAVLLLAAAFFAFALIGYTVLPLLFLAIAVVLGLYRLIFINSSKNPRRAKGLKTTLTGLIIIGVICLTAVEIPIISGAHTDKEPRADYVIVLGAGVNGTAPSLSLLNRLDAVKEYLETYPDSIAVLSGGQGKGEDITEAECMRRWLVSNGIEEDRLLLEEKSTSTKENLQFSMEIINRHFEDDVEKLAIVSSDYHLYRAKYMASEMGVEAVGVSARTTIPPLMVNYFLREALAVVRMWIM